MDAAEHEALPCGCAKHAAYAACACAALAVLIARSRKAAYYACFIGYVAIVSVLLAGVIPFFMLNPWSPDNSVWATDLLMRHITKVLGISWTLRGGHHVAVKRGGVIVANHQSCLDVLGMFQLWPTMGRCSAVGRKELFYIWPFALASWLGGMVFIDRKRPDSAKRQLEIVSKVMHADKTKLWMFPEGTRNARPETLLPFKKGAFRMAIDCQVPVMPVVYTPYYFIDHEKHEFSKGKMIMKALPPIETTGLTVDDVNDLMERTRKAMQDAVDALCKEVLAEREHTIP